MLTGGSMSVDDAIASYLTSLRARKPSAHTITAYSTDLRLVHALLDPDPRGLTVADLTVGRLRSGFAAYADDHARASILRAWSVWNRLCDHLVTEGAIPGNPMAGVPKPRASASAPHAFTESDVGSLIETLQAGTVPARAPWPLRDYAIIATLVLTGLRRSELVALCVQDVEGPEGAKQISVRHGKGDKYRAVPIDPRLEALLGEYLDQRWRRFPAPGRSRPDNPWSAPAGAPMWVGDQGRAMTSSQLGHLVTRAYRAAGINSRRPSGALVHALRHTFATSLLENGTTAVELMGLLGHESLQTTQRYLTTRPEHLRSAVAANPVYGRLGT